MITMTFMMIQMMHVPIGIRMGGKVQPWLLSSPELLDDYIWPGWDSFSKISLSSNISLPKAVTPNGENCLAILWSCLQYWSLWQCKLSIALSDHWCTCEVTSLNYSNNHTGGG